ncbi:MAG TPA: hypothetical protein VLK37_04945 [Solirubrobacterales bacterium]|nr:hypothetical protein [Solirubrobacterales bacterium]
MDAPIVQALEAAGPLSTRQLSIRLGADHQHVYRRCKQLEKDGRLTSDLVGSDGKNIFFFPMTREIVTTDNHDRIEAMTEAIAEIIRAHALPLERTQLAAALELQFERLAERSSGGAGGTIEEFAIEVLNAVASADKRSDVTKHLGIRPMRPTARVWALGRQLSLT